MYWAAHRVRSPSGAQAIHVFVRAHGAGFTWPEDASRLPEENPGELVRQQTPGVAPGGNEVESYLDVLAPDTIGDAVVEAVCSLRIEEQPNPFVATEDGVTIRFGCELRLEARRQAELRELCRAIWPTC